MLKLKQNSMKFVRFWVIPRRLSSNCRRFIDLPMKMEPIVSSETSAIRTQTPGNYPKRNKLHVEHGESLKTRKFNDFIDIIYIYIYTMTCFGVGVKPSSGVS